jgi:hypothetical protein
LLYTFLYQEGHDPSMTHHVTDMTAKVDPNTGKITEYRAGVKISFAVEHESR